MAYYNMPVLLPIFLTVIAMALYFLMKNYFLFCFIFLFLKQDIIT